MDTSRWQQTTNPLRTYTRRQPETTPLYRIVYHYHDKLARVWEQRFQQRYGVLRDEVLSAFESYLDCGIVTHGAARAQCECCNHSILIAFSCKARGCCPSCGAKRAAMFAEHLHERVMAPVDHRHIVFSIPKRLRAFFRYDRSLHGILFTAAWQTICSQIDGGIPGLILVVQTAGESLNHNPHLHGILSDGLWSPDGTFVPFVTPLDPSLLVHNFAARVTDALVARELLHPVHAEALLAQAHTGFSVWLGDPIAADDADGRRFLARYIDRPPLSHDRLSVRHDTVRYHSDTTESWKGHPLEFLARLSPHLPNKWEQCTRYFGHYSSRTRGKARRESSFGVVIEIPQDSSSDKKPPNRSWARMIKQIFELDPLCCPRCGGAMHIRAFITDHQELSRLMNNLGIAQPRAPPAIPAAELEYLEH